jgi:hypothetical protein
VEQKQCSDPGGDKHFLYDRGSSCGRFRLNLYGHRFGWRCIGYQQSRKTNRRPSIAGKWGSALPAGRRALYRQHDGLWATARLRLSQRLVLPSNCWDAAPPRRGPVRPRSAPGLLVGLCRMDLTGRHRSLCYILGESARATGHGPQCANQFKYRRNISGHRALGKCLFYRARQPASTMFTRPVL